MREAGPAPDGAVQITRMGGAGGIVSADGRYLYFARKRYGNENCAPPDDFAGGAGSHAGSRR